MKTRQKLTEETAKKYCKVGKELCNRKDKLDLAELLESTAQVITVRLLREEIREL